MNSFRHLTRHVHFTVILFYDICALSSFLPSFFYHASHTALSYTFLRQPCAYFWRRNCGKLRLPLCVVFAKRHGRTNVVVMGVVARHRRVATHRACVYLRTCTRRRARIGVVGTCFVDNETRLKNWFLIIRLRANTFTIYNNTIVTRRL